MVKFGIVGAMGRMGRAIAEAAASDREVELAAGFDNVDHPHSGMETGLSVDVFPINHKVLASLDGIIDFSLPGGTMEALKFCREHKTALVIGTTGFSQEQLSEIKEASKELPILMATNMSLGVNLLFALTRFASEALYQKGFQAEVTEIHHKHKVDAPSGTAKTLESILLDALKLNKDVIYGRSGVTGERGADDLGVFALRGGDVVGEHTVYYFGEGERVELKHQATSRSTFAKGAVEALKFLLLRTEGAPGLYNMGDVLNLKF